MSQVEMTNSAREDSSDPGLERLPITVLTGFLGSGKTTLLKALLQHSKMGDVAVVINEFGEVGLDHILVEHSSEDTVIMESGCLCCTIRGDLVETLRDLVKRRWNKDIPQFQRLVIETTGLADPAPILHTIMTDPVISSRYRLDGVVVTVDAVNGALQLDENEESVKQAAVADRLILTKTDMISGPDPDRLPERLRSLNPSAKIFNAVKGEIDPDCLFDAGLYNPATKSADVQRWLNEEAYAQDHARDPHHDPHHDPNHDQGHGNHHDHDQGHHHHHHHHHDVNRHDDRVHSFCITYKEPLEWDLFVEWIEALISIHGGNMLRLKGILNVIEADGPVAVHGVQHVFHPPAVLPEWPENFSEARESKLVMIVRDLSKEAIEKMLHAFMKQGAAR